MLFPLVKVSICSKYNCNTWNKKSYKTKLDCSDEVLKFERKYDFSNGVSRMQAIVVQTRLLWWSFSTSYFLIKYNLYIPNLKGPLKQLMRKFQIHI